MKEVHDFHQRLLGFFLTRHITEGDSRIALIKLGCVLAEGHHPSAPFVHTLHDIVTKEEQKS